EVEKITQIDIVPTIAIGMGIPIPYSNIGTPIRDIILGREEKLEDIQRYVNALNITTNQIIRYLKEKEGIIRETWISEIEEEIQKVQKEEIQWFENQEKLLELMNEHERISHEIHKQYVEHKSTFKFNYMLAGIIVMIVSLVCGLLFVFGYPQFHFTTLKIIHGFILGMVPALFLRRIYDIGMSKIDQYVFFTSLLGGLSFISNFASQFNTFILSGTRITTTVTFDIIVNIILCFIYGFGQYTDSYIKEEEYTSFYVAEWISIIMFFFALSQRKQGSIKILCYHFLLIILSSCIKLFSFHVISLLLLPIVLYLITHSINISISSICALVYHLIRPYPTSFLGIILPDTIYLLTLISLVMCYKQRLSVIHYLYSLIPLATVILPYSSSTILLLFIGFVYVFKEYEFSESITTFFLFIGIHFFFLSGHAFQFSDIQFNAGFIGIPFYSFFGNGFLVILNTFFFPGIVVLAIAGITQSKVNGTLLYTRSSILVMLFFSYQLLSIMIFTYFVSGHLEIFRIFTPKVCFDAAITVVVDVIVFVVYFILREAKSEH
ncbi:phosphatidylinositolglycan biosynthesis class O protein, putative, partial [Entamoeba histolytica KU27]